MSKENKENSTAAYIKPMIDVISMGQESLMAAVSDADPGGAPEGTPEQNAKQMGDDDSDLWDEE